MQRTGTIYAKAKPVITQPGYDLKLEQLLTLPMVFGLPQTEVRLIYGLVVKVLNLGTKKLLQGQKFLRTRLFIVDIWPSCNPNVRRAELYSKRKFWRCVLLSVLDFHNAFSALMLYSCSPKGYSKGHHGSLLCRKNTSSLRLWLLGGC